MPKLRFKKSELIPLGLALVLFFLSFGIYVSNFPIGNYLFKKPAEVVDELAKLNQGKKTEPIILVKNRQGGIGDSGGNNRIESAKSSVMSTVSGKNGSSPQPNPVKSSFSSNPLRSGIGSIQVKSTPSGTNAPSAKNSLRYGNSSTYSKRNMSRPELKIPAKKQTLATRPSLPLPLKQPIPSPTPVSLPKPSPKPIIAMKALPPSPKPSPAVQKDIQFVILAPTNGAKIQPSDGTGLPEIPVTFSWTALPADANLVLRIKFKDKEIFNKPMAAKNGKASFLWHAKAPGNYQMELLNPQNESFPATMNPTRQFEILPDFMGIELLPPLINEKSIAEAQVGSPLQSRRIKFQWKPYPDALDYWLIVRTNAHPEKPLIEQKLQKTEFISSEDIENAEISYQIITKLKNGFNAKSKKNSFIYNVNPPKLLGPQNKTVFIENKQKKPVVLKWTASKPATKYVLEIANDPQFKSIYTSLEPKRNIVSIERPPKGFYWWRVSSLADRFLSPKSEAFSFSVAQENEADLGSWGF